MAAGRMSRTLVEWSAGILPAITLRFPERLRFGRDHSQGKNNSWTNESAWRQVHLASSGDDRGAGRRHFVYQEFFYQCGLRRHAFVFESVGRQD
jgi:hypothetical protein